ncbi:winged helix-turn-helix transcriptional regulator [Methanofollis aquaemaris]|nr:winged helix-turn-helix transcriptional regulator [Methanofollis aquaemaris]
MPSEVRDAVNPLSSDKAWAVFMALMRHGDLRFSELKAIFESSSSGDIDKFLKKLEMAGIVERKVKDLGDAGDSSRVYYGVSYLGRRLNESLLQGLFGLRNPSDQPEPRLDHGASCSAQNKGIVSGGTPEYTARLKTSPGVRTGEDNHAPASRREEQVRDRRARKKGLNHLRS